MVWWIVPATVGALGIANYILNKLKRAASVQRLRWHNEHQQLEQQIIRYEQRIAHQIREAQKGAEYHQLRQLHYESFKTADVAYMLLSDARVSLNAIGIAIRDAGKEKKNLIYQKDNTPGAYKKSKLNQEIISLISLRNHLFPDKDQLKHQRNQFYSQVNRLNSQTHTLKSVIRDRCGSQGREWYQRLEERSRQKRIRVVSG